LWVFTDFNGYKKCILIHVDYLPVCAHDACGFDKRRSVFNQIIILLLFVQKTDNKTNTKNISILFMFENNFEDPAK
jgi:hypothetical protein